LACELDPDAAGSWHRRRKYFAGIAVSPALIASMLLIDPSLDAANTADGAAAPPMALRLESPDGEVTLYGLPLGKSTVGSGSKCTIRLQRSGVEPIHCVIIRTAEGATIRRWAEPTRLNGEWFDEAQATSGDWLTVGTLELEFVGEPSGTAESPVARPKMPAGPLKAAEAETPRSAPLEPPAQAAAIFPPSETALAVARLRARKLIAALRREREAQRPLRDQIDNLVEERGRLLVEQQRLQDDLARFTAERNALANERDELRQLAERTPSVPVADESHGWGAGNAVTNAFDDAVEDQIAAEKPPASESSAWGDWSEAAPSPDTSPQPTESTPDDWSAAQLNDFTWQAAGPFADKDAGEPPMEWLSNLEEPPREAVAAVESDERPAELAPEALAETAPLWSFDQIEAATSAKPVEAAPATPPAKTSASYIERFAHMFEDDEAASVPPLGTPGGVEPAPASGAALAARHSPPKEALHAASTEEESIEEYMAKLLQRVRGDGAGQPASQSAAALAKPTSEPRAATDNIAPAAERPLNDPSLLQPAAQPSRVPLAGDEFKPMRQAMEQPATLQELRDLANQTARRAIAVHATHTYRQSALTKVIVSVLALMTGVWLMLQLPHWRDAQFISACMLMLIAAYWSGQTLHTFFASIRAGNYDGPDAEWEAEAGLRNSPLPIDIEDDRW
jgi:hypothetical protein